MMIHMDYRNVTPDAEMLLEGAHQVWLMDDHRWALFAWESHRRQTRAGRYALIHADFHWDGIDDFHDSEDASATLLAASLSDLHSMIESEERIRYDSFIAPAIRLDALSQIHWYCLQDQGEDAGVCAQLCDKHDVVQFFHQNVASLAAANADRPLIFDLCLDLFNRSDNYYEGDLWSDEEVLGFLDAVRDHIRVAELVTISLSFGYSGSEDDTRHLAELVVPRILAMRAESP